MKNDLQDIKTKLKEISDRVDRMIEAEAEPKIEKPTMDKQVADAIKLGKEQRDRINNLGNEQDSKI